MKVSAIDVFSVTLLVFWTPVQMVTTPATPAPTHAPTAAPTTAPVTCAPNMYRPPSCVPCGNCSVGTTCDVASGSCPAGCQPGYIPPTCATACRAGYYGNNCTQACGKCDGPVCNAVTGSCLQCIGNYELPLCTACRAGYYGNNCTQACGKCDGPVCDAVTGRCSQCIGNYELPLCTACRAGYYGINCMQACGKCTSPVCNAVTGSCLQCIDNYELPLCKDCVPGQWASACGQRCGQCGGDGRCDRQTGTCLLPCQDGWTGPTCTHKCVAGLYGSNCSSACGRCRGNANCRHDNGLCEGGCEGGYEGVLCDREQVDLRATIAGSAMGAAALIAASIVCTLLFLNYRRGNSNCCKGTLSPRHGQTQDTSHSDDLRDAHHVSSSTATCAPSYAPLDSSKRDIHLYERQHVPLPLGSSDTAFREGEGTYQNVEPSEDRSTGPGTNKQGNKSCTAPVERIYGNT